MFSNNYENKKQFTKISQKQFLQIYTMIETVGKGSFGQVFKAKNNHNKIVAIKRFLSGKTNYFMLIAKEIINLKKLQHSNILKFYQCYIVDDSKYYLVTQFCQNGKLDSYLQDHALSVFEKISIAQQIAQGLAYAHSQNVVHRDLKPDNILIGAKNTVKIGDFGCSRSLQDQKQILNSVVGSPAYMDDRIMQNEDYDLTVDIYSLGLVFTCIFTGKGIFDYCKSRREISQMKKLIYQDYDKRIGQILDGIPQPMHQIIKNSLQENHKLRYSALIISQKLKQYLVKQKEKLSKVSSTLDELQSQIKDKQILLAIDLLSIVKQNNFKLQCQENQNQIYLLLNNYKNNFNKIVNIEKLKYVSSDTKAQYTFIVMLYYIYWLEQMDNFVHQKTSTLSQKYKNIDPVKIQKNALDVIQVYIKGQLQKIKPGLTLCGKKIQKVIHLLDKRLFLPQKFQQCVYNITQSVKIDLSKYEEKQLSYDIRTFFDKRIKKEYEYNSPQNETADQRLLIIEEIGKKFN